VSSVTDMSRMFGYTTSFSTENYDNLLIGWASLTSLQPNVIFDAPSTSYCNGETARDYIINTYGWTITDAGLDCSSLSVDDIDKLAVSIYPNPVSSELMIKVNSYLINKPYAICDVLGQVLLKGRLNDIDTVINVESLVDSIYFLNIADSKTHKFVKQ